LLGNTDYYVRHILRNRDRILGISDNFIIPMTSIEQFDTLFDKESFYRLCDEHELPYPKSIVFDFAKDNANDYQIPFDFPVFMKPSDTVEYARHDFAGKQKGYKICDRSEFSQVVRAISAGGFKGKFLLQEYIEGDDESMLVLTAYADQNSIVRAMALGKILMHDRTPERIGNYNAITHSYNERLCFKLKSFIEKIKFTGICHFDIQYDKKSNRFVIFEMNLRQGRGNLHTLASGMNLMKLVVDDYIYNRADGFFIANRPFTVSVISRAALKYCLSKTGRQVPTENFCRFTLAPYDLNPMRLYCQARWDFRVIREYLQYQKG
ncbi:MAG: hypothetical protein GX303_07405, partial [Clostridiales bacterium]|nr:hypothetical protein [Clostridiales bacterium]